MNSLKVAESPHAEWTIKNQLQDANLRDVWSFQYPSGGHQLQSLLDHPATSMIAQGKVQYSI